MNSKMETTELLIKLIDLGSNINRQLAGPLSMHGIGLTEYLVLRHLQQSEEQRMRRVDLAARVGLTPSGITRLLNPMEKMGLVQKQANPRDARVSLVELTSEGEQIFQDASQGFNQSAEQLLKRFNFEDQQELTRLLGLIL